MKITLLNFNATADELRANRTIADAIAEVIGTVIGNIGALPKEVIDEVLADDTEEGDGDG